MSTSIVSRNSARGRGLSLGTHSRPVASPVARAELIVGKHELHRWVGDHRGLVLSVREGTLWITQEADPDDVILHGGQSFRVNLKGTVVAEGLAARNRLEAK